MSHTMRRAVTAALALVTVTGSVAITGAANGAERYRARTSASVVQRALAANGSHLNGSYVDQGGVTQTFVDYGLTADAILALDASKAGNYQSGKATDYLAANLADYTDAWGTTYAGATAKALLVAESQKVTPAYTLGGVNLLTKLQALETPSGRFSDVNGTDYSNTFSQAFAIIAERRAGVTVSDAAASYLLLQQCPNGGVRSSEDATQCSTNSSADPDATSMAVQALLTLPTSATNRTAIRQAIRYLKSQTNRVIGGVHGSGQQRAVNSNTTALASISFRATGARYYANLTVRYLNRMRYGCSYPKALRGYVAYNRAAKQEQRAAGAAAKPTDQDLRSTTQAILGFAGRPYGKISNSGATASSPRVSC